MGKQMKNCMIRCIRLLLCGVLAGTLLLTAVFAVPVNEEHRTEAMEIFDAEGSHPILPILNFGSGYEMQYYLPGLMDNYTDALMVSTATDTNFGNVLSRAMRMYSDRLEKDYPYYWHGYVVLLRPLLWLFDYSELRIVNFLGQLALLGALAFALRRKECNRGLTAVLFSSYALLFPMAMAMGLQYTWIYYIAGGGSLFLICRGSRMDQNLNYVPFFLLLGMCTSFFDLLTFPLLTWGLPLLWWLVTSAEEEYSTQAVKKYLGRVVVTGIPWIAGYGLMWFGKWCVSTLILRENVIRSAVDEIFLRTGVDEGVDLYERFNACYSNWKHYEYKVYAVILLGWLLLWMVLYCLQGYRRSPRYPAYLLIGASSVVWYFVLANHTLVHHFFTYRIYGVSILAFLCIVWESVLRKRPKFRWDAMVPKRTALYLAQFLGIGVVAVVLAKTAREDLLASNGHCEYRYETVEENTSMEVLFYPTFSRINSMTFTMNSESTTGVYEIELRKDGVVVDAYSVPITELEGISYYVLDTKWNLKAGQEYVLRITPRGNNAPTRAELTNPGEMPLMELKSASVGETAVEGQPLMVFSYGAPPLSGYTKIFMLLTWFAVLLSLWTALSQELLYRREKKKSVPVEEQNEST